MGSAKLFEFAVLSVDVEKYWTQFMSIVSGFCYSAVLCSKTAAELLSPFSLTQGVTTKTINTIVNSIQAFVERSNIKSGEERTGFVAEGHKIIQIYVELSKLRELIKTEINNKTPDIFGQKNVQSLQGLIDMQALPSPSLTSGLKTLISQQIALRQETVAALATEYELDFAAFATSETPTFLEASTISIA